MIYLGHYSLFTEKQFMFSLESVMAGDSDKNTRRFHFEVTICWTSRNSLPRGWSRFHLNEKNM